MSEGRRILHTARGVAARRRRQEISDVAIDAEVMPLPTEDRGRANGHRIDAETEPSAA